MAKLTEAQKAINKEAASLRNKAYTARRKEYRDAIQAIEAQLQSSDAHRRVKAARAALDAECESNQALVNSIQEKIKLLEESLKKVAAYHEARMATLRSERNNVFDAYKAIEKEAKAPIDEEYADINGPNAFGAASWKPIEAFVPFVTKKN